LQVKNIERPVVWDPSIGFSARLLGFAAVCEGGTYIGTDPATMMFTDAMRLGQELKDRIIIDIRQVGSELVKIEKESLDLVYTSPPYFSLEQYVDEPGQCWRDYPDIDSWTKQYLFPTFQTAFDSLKSERYMVINISNNLSDIIENVAGMVGFKRRSDLDLKMSLGRDHFHRKHGYVDERFEPFLVFEKK